MQNSTIDKYVPFTFQILSQWRTEGVKTVEILVLNSKSKVQAIVEMVPSKENFSNLTSIQINSNELAELAYYDHPMVKYVVKTSVFSDNS